MFQCDTCRAPAYATSISAGSGDCVEQENEGRLIGNHEARKGVDWGIVALGKRLED